MGRYTRSPRLRNGELLKAGGGAGRVPMFQQVECILNSACVSGAHVAITTIRFRPHVHCVCPRFCPKHLSNDTNLCV